MLLESCWRAVVSEVVSSLLLETLTFIQQLLGLLGLELLGWVVLL